MNNKQLIASELAKVIDSLDQDAIFNLLEQPKSSELGDIAFPAFSLAKVERKAPQIIATDIAEKIDTTNFEKVVATGPYVNFFLDKSKISAQVIKEIVKEGNNYGQQDEGHGENITIDLSSPNIAKPFSVGHLRSTVIGDALSNIFRKLGYNTIKINHLGDWGKQFGLLMVAYKKWGSKEAVEASPIDELLKLYVRINAEIETDPELDDEGRLWFKKLEDGDPEATELWQWFRDESLKEFNRIYKLLGVEFDSLAGEAFYNDKMDEGIKLLEEKGLLEESKGASIVNLDDVNLPPAMIKKSDGATLYITRDIATAMYRARTYNFVKNVYAVGQEQANHFRQLKAVLNVYHVYSVPGRNGQPRYNRVAPCRYRLRRCLFVFYSVVYAQFVPLFSRRILRSFRYFFRPCLRRHYPKNDTRMVAGFSRLRFFCALRLGILQSV